MTAFVRRAESPVLTQVLGAAEVGDDLGYQVALHVAAVGAVEGFGLAVAGRERERFVAEAAYIVSVALPCPRS